MQVGSEKMMWPLRRQLRKVFLFFLSFLHAPSKRGIIIKVQSPSSSLTNTNILTTAPTLAGTRGESAHCPHSLGFESRGQEICATRLGQTRNEAKPRTGEDVFYETEINTQLTPEDRLSPDCLETTGFWFYL